MKTSLLILFATGMLLTGCTVPPTDTANIEQKASQEEITGVVSSITDGDTYNVVISENHEIKEGIHLSAGEEITIRLLLIDTPESIGEKAGMPYGKEASSYAQGLLQGREVTIEFDEGDIKDKYDRYLTYIYTDGERVQDHLLENGYAMVRYVNEPNTRYLKELQKAEENARRQETGIWSIENYVSVEEGFNESVLKPDLSAIGEDVKNKATETAQDLFGETIEYIVDSIEGQ